MIPFGHRYIRLRSRVRKHLVLHFFLDRLTGHRFAISEAIHSR